MSYFDFFGFGSMVALSGCAILIGWALKLIGIGPQFGGYVMALGTIVFILTAMFAMIRMLKPAERLR